MRCIISTVVAITALTCGCSQSESGGAAVDATVDGGETLTAGGDVSNDVAVAEDVALPPYTLPSFDIGAVDFPFCPTDEAAIDALMSALGRDGQIGQHLMFGVASSGSQIDEMAATMIATYQPGGVFLGAPMGIAVGDPVKTARIVRSAQIAATAATGVPLLVSLDQEGGPNSSVNSVTGGTDTLGSMPTGATLSAQSAFDQFSVMGREIAALGFNMALAPVLDTLTSTRNGNLNTRAFGPDPALNAVLGVASMAGFQRHGVIAVGKHFPGDGLSSHNPHTTFVTIEVDRATLDETLLVPFRAAIDAGIDGIMTMPARFTALDPDQSAIISRKVTTDVLRQELGFEGLVVTDSLGMVGASIGLPEGQSEALTALQAGADILLEVVMLDEDAAALVAEIDGALEDGALDAAEFEASTRRILRTKQRYCLFEEPGVSPTEIDAAAVTSSVGLEESRALMAAHAQDAVVVLHDDGVLPLTGQRALYVGPDTLFQDAGSTWLNVVDQTMADAMRRHDSDVLDALIASVGDSGGRLSVIETADEGELRRTSVVVWGIATPQLNSLLR
ncbi:MAG: glycoside hydrolase family 3 N-terminal domain-containing protein, partial [Myxococcota bacterium]|nr:glycoside hydrolase family 3 N-terminal domain-containing protein [Myxococcota bacterium]